MDNQYQLLADQIRFESRFNHLTWSPSNYLNTYQTPLGIGTIMIMYDEDAPREAANGYPNPMYTLSFINERGETFHSLVAIDDADSNYELLKEIYESAHNSYMKIEETLKSMFDDIFKRT